MNKLVIALLLVSVQGTRLERMKVDGVNLDIDEEPDLKDPVDTKKEFKTDIVNLQAAVEEFSSAQEKVDQGGLAPTRQRPCYRISRRYQAKTYRG
jgi:hypothetical protein